MAVIIEECRLQIMSKLIALNVMVKPGVPRRLCVDVVVAFAEDSRFRRKNTFVARTKAHEDQLLRVGDVKRSSYLGVRLLLLLLVLLSQLT